MVIRRLDQHCQNSCGFESIGTAKLCLGVRGSESLTVANWGKLGD
jgi:hypothetical protein